VRASNDVTAVVLAAMAVGVMVTYWPVTIVILTFVVAGVVITRGVRKRAHGQNSTAVRKIDGR
jgi:uncharacterized integral membrane protein